MTYPAALPLCPDVESAGTIGDIRTISYRHGMPFTATSNRIIRSTTVERPAHSCGTTGSQLWNEHSTVVERLVHTQDDHIPVR